MNLAPLTNKKPHALASWLIIKKSDWFECNRQNHLLSFASLFQTLYIGFLPDGYVT